jgi:TRAP-type C4-dicarboxylate transport system substrate-binding protein
MSPESKRGHIAAVVLACLVVTSCQHTQVIDKTGNSVLVLRFATIDTLDPNGQTPAPGIFINALERLSGGRIKVTVTSNFEAGAPAAESDIVRAIAKGEFDGGWPTTRAFGNAGIRGLEPIEAPMVLTSYAAEKAVVKGSAGPALLKTLAGSGVVGLGLTVGPLRRPFSQRPALVDAQAWRGITFRSLNSPTQDATIRALGGIPVEASFNFPDLVTAGTLRGAETDVAQYEINDYGTLLPVAVANEVLWPRMEVLSFSQRRYDSLTSTERGWVQSAAQQAVQASVDYPYDDAAQAGLLCGQGVRFSYATPAQLAALHLAVQPVLDALARDPVTARSLAEVRAAAAPYPTADSFDVASSCLDQ